MAGENLHLEEAHPISHRRAILDDDGTSAWLYLTEPNSHKPVADAWVYNRIPAPAASTIKSYQGGPPPAALGYVTTTAICTHPAAFTWTFVWASNGDSVAVARDGKPVAFIIAGEGRGYSRELSKQGGWGSPWSDELFRQKFGSP